MVAWIVDDTGLPKQGKHSVGVARQYCGQIGKHDNCQAAVSLQDSERRQQAGVPDEMVFQTKPEIALEQMRQAMAQEISAGVVLADAGYGNGMPFRTAVTELGLPYVVGIESSTTVWEPGQQPLPAPPRRPGRGRTPEQRQRDAGHQPRAVKELALHLPAATWKDRNVDPSTASSAREIRPAASSTTAP